MKNSDIPSKDRLLRLNEVLQRVPVCRAAWYQGVRDGKYPKPIKLGSRTAVYAESWIDKLVADIAEAKSTP